MNEKIGLPLQTTSRVAAPVGTAPSRRMNLGEAVAVFSSTINHHVWTANALDVFETHSFTGHPGEARWCSRCTLALPADWKKPGGPLPPKCGSATIMPKLAMYTYARDAGEVTLKPADAGYTGATVAPDKEPDA